MSYRLIHLKAMLVLLVLIVFVVVLLICSELPIRTFVNAELSRYVYHISDNSYNTLSYSGPDVIIRAVYVDDRPRYGYKNVSVFLVEIRKTILHGGLIMGCKVGKRYTTKYSIHSLNINGMVGQFIDEKPFLTHAMAMIDCYNIEAKNGSNAYLVYRRKSNGLIFSVESDKPVFVPNHSSMLSYKVSACVAVVYNSPPYLNKWIHYQKAIGIDHVLLLADETFTGLADIKQEIENGYLTIEIWKQKLKSNVHNYIVSFTTTGISRLSIQITWYL